MLKFFYFVVCFFLFVSATATAQDINGLILQKEGVQVLVRAERNSPIVEKLLAAGWEEWSPAVEIEEAEDDGYGVAIFRDDCVDGSFFLPGKEGEAIKKIEESIPVTDDGDWANLE